MDDAFGPLFLLGMIFTLGGATLGKVVLGFSWWGGFGILVALLVFIGMIIVFLYTTANKSETD